MRKQNFLATLTIALFISSSLLLFPMPARAASGITIAFDYYHVQVANQTIYRAYGLPGPSYEVVDRNNMNGNLTKAGYTLDFLNQTTPITTSELTNVNVQIIGNADDPPINYSASEVQAITSWFQTGNKLLMVSGNSGYTSNDTENTNFQSTIPNWVLKSIGSSLRLETGGEVTDQPGVGASGSGFRVYAAASNTGVISQGWAANLTTGTSKVRFHGPINVIGYQNGAYVPFSSLTANTVTWLYRTSAQGTLQQYGSGKPYVTAYSAPGQYVLAAAEKIPEGGSYSKVVVAGAGFYGGYIIAADTEFSYNIQFQGTQFILNSIKWGTTAESVPGGTDWLLYGAIAAVIIIVVAAAAIYAMRRKPKAMVAPTS